jgi:putative tryptophan/tyrosine transport system substrate-binding protein
MRKLFLIVSFLIAIQAIDLTRMQQALAQQAQEPVRVGILGSGPPLRSHPVIASFRKELAALGYSEGLNLVVEERWQPPDKKEWLPEAIAALERVNVRVILAYGAVAARALKSAGTRIPVVFIMVIPTAEFVSNPARPEGNMTGFTNFDPKLARQQLELLKQVVPNAKRIAFLGDEVVGDGPFKPHEAAARALGFEPLILKLRALQLDIDGAFATMHRERVDALVTLAHPIIRIHRLKIGENAKKSRLPSLFPTGGADAGGILTYGTELIEMAKPAAIYVDQILKGAKPSELPVRPIINHQLIVNLKTAEVLSMNIPPEVLKAAAAVIR